MERSKFAVRTIIPATPGWFVITVWGDDDNLEVHKEPIIAWLCEVDAPREDLPNYETEFDRRGFTFPICVEGVTEDYIGIQRPDGTMLCPHSHEIPNEVTVIEQERTNREYQRLHQQKKESK